MISPLKNARLIQQEHALKTIETWAEELENQTPGLLNKIQLLELDPAVQPKKLLIEVLKFLYLVAHSKQPLTPAFQVDLAWHEFILFTRAYAQFCNDKFGRFIHHTPDDNKAQNNNRFVKTIHQYVATFGEPPLAIWGAFANEEWKDLNCGSCKTQ